METLNFKGPFHISQLVSLGINKPGIYIWGFAFNLDRECKLKEPIDFTINEISVKNSEFCNFDIMSWKFIPYYVGKAIGGKSTIRRRLLIHHKINQISGAKYIRLCIEYYKEFFKDPTFPINTNGSDWIIEKNNFRNKLYGRVEYFNSEKVLKKIYSNNCKPIKDNSDNFPIDLQNYIQRDTLKEIILERNNFWFCYAELENPTEADEAQVFYSLKGKTISKTKLFSNKLINHSINPSSTCKTIFKQKQNGTIECVNDFKGYLDDTQY